MPRRKYKKPKRSSVDPKYNDPVLGLTINVILKRGKKSLAERLMYDALDLVEKKTGKPGPEVFQSAIKNITPSVMVKSRRVGGATYQVPVELQHDKGRNLAINWLLQYARDRKGASFPERLSEEIIDAAENRGGAIKKKSDTHKMAEANKAFSHYRF